MTAIDPAYRRRLQRAIARALIAELGEDGYRRLLAEVRRRHAAAPDECTGLVVGSGLGTPEMGESTHEDDRDAD